MKTKKAKRYPLIIIYIVGISIILIASILILDFITESAIRSFGKSMMSSYSRDMTEEMSKLVSSNVEDLASSYSLIFHDVEAPAKQLSVLFSKYINRDKRNFNIDIPGLKLPRGTYYWGDFPYRLPIKDISALYYIKYYIKFTQEMSPYYSHIWLNMFGPKVLLTHPDCTAALLKANHEEIKSYFERRYLKYDELYLTYQKDKQAPVWTVLKGQPFGKEGAISIAYPIFDNVGNFLGFLGVELDIANVMREIFPKNNWNMYKAYFKYSFLLTDDLSIVYISDYLRKEFDLPNDMQSLDSFDSAVKFLNPVFGSPDELLSGSENKRMGIFFENIKGTYCIVAFSRIECNNWIAGAVLPLDMFTKSLVKAKDKMNNTIRDLSYIYLIISFVFLFITVVLSSLFFWYMVLSPMESVSAAIRKLGQGIFNADIRIRGVLEIAQLAHGVKKLGRGLTVYIENLKREEKIRLAIENEFETTSEIQRSILPNLTDDFKREEFDLDARIVSASGNISGDFYDFFYLDSSTLVLVVGDVSGKGISAAFFMNLSKIVIKNVCLQSSSMSPAAVLMGVNGILSLHNDASMFLTMYLCFYDIPTGKLTYANAGHHDVMKVNPSGDVLAFGSLGNPLVGVYSDVSYKDNQLRVEKGDVVVFYTDGVLEAINTKKEPFGEQRLSFVLGLNKSKKSKEINEAVITSVMDFEGGQRFDDITLLTLKRHL